MTAIRRTLPLHQSTTDQTSKLQSKVAANVYQAFRSKIKPALQAYPYLDITKCALHCMMGDDVAPVLKGLRNKRSRDESWE